MKTPTLIASLAMALASLGAAPLAAQSSGELCGERAYFVDQLVGTYKEQPVAGGLQSENSLVEIWASEATGSFTILVTGSDGRTCVAFTGENFQEASGFAAVKGEAS